MQREIIGLLVDGTKFLFYGLLLLHHIVTFTNIIYDGELLGHEVRQP